MALWLFVGVASAVGVVRRSEGVTGRWRILVVIGLLALGTRIYPTGFYGLEYEDAYVYAAAAKFADVAPVEALASSLTVTVCAVGSLEACDESEGYPGHLNGYSALLRAVTALLGYAPAMYPAIGAVLGALTALSVWWAIFVLTGSVSAGIGGALLFATTPTLALYGGSAVSETASSFALGAWCGACAEALCGRSETPSRRWAIVAFAAAILAALIRREDALCLPLTALCVSYAHWPRLTQRARVALVVTSIAVILPVAFLGARSVASELGEIGEVSFSMFRLLSTTPTILTALASPLYFGALLWVSLAGVAVVVNRIRLRTVSPADIFVCSLVFALGAWGLSYGAHFRSVYQLAGVAVTPFEFLRYLSNTGVLLCVIAGVAIESARVHSPRWTWVALSLMVAAGCVGAWTLRRELADVEMSVRTEPARAALVAAAELGASVPILTLETYVAQLQGAPSAVVVSLRSLTKSHLKEMGEAVVYLEHDRYQNDVDRKRYAAGFAALPTRKQLLRQGNGWRVWLLHNNDSGDRDSATN